MNRKNLEFASLLYDIGKFYYRTGRSHSDDYKNLSQENFGLNGAHGKWSSDFINKYWNSIIADLALYHHAPSNSKTNKEFLATISAYPPSSAKSFTGISHNFSKESILRITSLISLLF